MVKAKQQGPGARKYACGKCRVLRWTEQFGGVSVTKLNPSSVCDLCKLEVSFSRQLEELKTIFQSQVTDYEARLSILEEENKSLRIGGACLTSTPVDKKKEKKKKKKNKKDKSKVENKETRESQKVENIENRQVVEKKLNRKKKEKEQEA